MNATQQRTLPLAGTLLLILLFTLSACKEKRISYVDMIKRETKEIDAFIAKEHIKIVNEIPVGKAMGPNEYAKVKEGLYIHVAAPGNGNKATSGKTIISARFSAKSISDPKRGSFTFSNNGSKSGGTHPLTFVYNKHSQILQLDPKATIGEMRNPPFLCAALQEAMSRVSEGATVNMIVSFREGPQFTADQGIALYFEELQLNFKK